LNPSLHIGETPFQNPTFFLSHGCRKSETGVYKLALAPSATTYAPRARPPEATGQTSLLWAPGANHCYSTIFCALFHAISKAIFNSFERKNNEVSFLM
jgi:hypothetical protein